MLKFMAPDVAADPHISIPVGITVGLIALFIQSLGLTIQRKSHVQNQKLPEGERKVEHRRPLWLLGFGIFISSNLFGSIFQIASLPVVILAPLGAVSLLWNAFFARLILGDVFSPWMIMSTLCIAGGAVLIAEFGIVPEPSHSLEDLLELFSRPAFIVYFSLLGVFTLVALVVTHAVEYSSSRRIALPADTPPLSPLLQPNGDPTILTAAVTPTSAPTANDERTPLIDPKLSRAPSLSSFSTYISASKTPLFLAMSYASFSGIIAGMCLLLAKSGVELLVISFSGNNQFWKWQTWALVLGLIICALLQLWYMHKSLVLADPTLVCPLAFCLYNLSSIINGLVYFDQFALLSTLHLLLVILGMVVLLAGVWIVSFPPSGSHGIDVGTWDEQQQTDSEAASDISDEISEHYEDEPLPMGGTQAVPRSPIDEAIGMARVSTSRTSPAHAETHLPSNEPVRSSSKSTRSSHTRRLTEPLVHLARNNTAPPYQPTSPTRRRRPSIPPPHQTTPGLQTSPRQSYPPYAHPLSPGTPSGFSIGLSPVSPGFSLVPRERVGRRRRVTSVEGEADFFASRRAVNEISAGDGTRVSEGADDHEPETQASSRSVEDIEAAGLHVGGRPAKGRWKFFAALSSFRK